MAGSLNLIKLSVGSESVDAIAAWQASRRATSPDGSYAHVTRMWPRRADELLDGGSIYWVVQGVVLARQRILELREMIGGDGITRCGIVLDPAIVRTEAMAKRPFQGWRYLTDADAPGDLDERSDRGPDLPPRMRAALAEIGVR